MIPLGTIEEEAAACRAAWAECPGATHGAHIHHEVACEELTEPIENRIAYILAEKPDRERAIRLRLMRPTTRDDANAYGEAVATAQKAYYEAKAPALKAYDETTATAWKAYDEVVAPARKAYNEAKATAHRLVCNVDGCPFDGRTIFPGGE